MNEYLVIGAGHQGLAMAAHFALNGEKVNLWNRSYDNIKDIIESDNSIICSGIINGIAKVNKVSTNINDVTGKIIFVATPSIANNDIAKMLANIVDKDTIIILNPGRTFGALKFLETLKNEGCKELPKIAETQTIIYTCRRTATNSVQIYALKEKVAIASLVSSESNEIMKCIPECMLEHLEKVDSTLNTSLNNVGMILHCAPTLLNAGRIESGVNFKYYLEGITPSIAIYLENLDKERMLVGHKLGIKLDSIQEWFKKTYGVNGNNLYECVNNDVYRDIDAPNTINHRYLNEDIPCGLVPLEGLGSLLGINMPYTSTIINLGSLMMQKDYRKIGRKINIDELKQLIENVDLSNDNECLLKNSSVLN